SLDELALAQHAFEFETAFFEYSLRSYVANDSSRLDAVDLHLAECEFTQDRRCFRNQTLSPVLPVDHVADLGALIGIGPLQEADASNDPLSLFRLHSPEWTNSLAVVRSYAVDKAVRILDALVGNEAIVL